jgi:hypothetical protein
MRTIARGQLFFADDKAGPLFIVRGVTYDGPFGVLILSHLTGEKMDEAGTEPRNGPGFKTFGEAMEWAMSHHEW